MLYSLQIALARIVMEILFQDWRKPILKKIEMDSRISFKKN